MRVLKFTSSLFVFIFLTTTALATEIKGVCLNQDAQYLGQEVTLEITLADISPKTKFDTSDLLLHLQISSSNGETKDHFEKVPLNSVSFLKNEDGTLTLLVPWTVTDTCWDRAETITIKFLCLVFDGELLTAEGPSLKILYPEPHPLFHSIYEGTWVGDGSVKTPGDEIKGKISLRLAPKSRRHPNSIELILLLVADPQGTPKYPYYDSDILLQDQLILDSGTKDILGIINSSIFSYERATPQQHGVTVRNVIKFKVLDEKHLDFSFETILQEGDAPKVWLREVHGVLQLVI